MIKQFTHYRRILWMAGLMGALITSLILVAVAAGEGPTRLVPIGASYEEATLELFAAQAAEHDTDGHVLIRVLPITYHTNPNAIGGVLRRENLELAAYRAEQIEEAPTVGKLPEGIEVGAALVTELKQQISV